MRVETLLDHLEVLSESLSTACNAFMNEDYSDARINVEQSLKFVDEIASKFCREEQLTRLVPMGRDQILEGLDE
jgi:hypothetical protein